MMKSKLNAFDWIALAVLVVGGLSWGFVGLFDFDLVAFPFVQDSREENENDGVAGEDSIFRDWAGGSY